MLEDAGPAAGDRYKKAKYGDDDDDAADGGNAASGIAALAGSAEDVPPNFEILVVFALGLLRAMLRKMSGEKGVGGKAGDEQDDAADEAGSGAWRERAFPGVNKNGSSENSTRLPLDEKNADAEPTFGEGARSGRSSPGLHRASSERALFPARRNATPWEGRDARM